MKAGTRYEYNEDSGIFHAIQPANTKGAAVASRSAGAQPACVNCRPDACATLKDAQMRVVRIAIFVLTAFAALALANAHAADATQRTFDLAIAHGALPPSQRVMKVKKGDAVQLRIASDAPGELHVHGYRLEAKLAPGTRAELAFTAYATGRFPLEWHRAGDAIAAGSPHRSAPLATLEVHPR